MSEPGAAPRTVDPRVTDVVLALAMALVVAVVIAADPDAAQHAGPGAYLFAVGFGALILVRRRAPRTVLVVTVLAVFVYYTLQFSPIGMALPAVAAIYSAAELRRTGWALGGGAALVAVATYYRTVGNTPEEALAPYDLVTNVALVAAAVALGVAVRLSREARGHEARAAEQRLQAERLRIARDLHDVVGHNLSVIALHSGLAGVDTLASSARAAGLVVDVELDVPAGTLDGAIDAAAYRVVQESLTNVLRHAAARRVVVSAAAVGGRLALRVADDGRGAGPGLVPGTGISGMRERVALLGGTLTTGDAPGGGFLVAADLPLRLEA